MKRTILILILAAAIAVGGFFGFRAYKGQEQSQASSQFKTEVIQKGDLTTVVGGTGTVRSNQVAQVTWQTSGTVDQLFFEQGSQVRSGDTLATLSEQSLSQSMILARADLVEAQRALAKLTDSDVAQASAYQNLTAAEKELKDANTQRLSKQYTRGSQSTIDQNQADVILAQDAYNNAVDNWNAYSGRDDADVGKANALSRLAAARKALDRAKANLQYVQTMPNDLEIAQADARIQLAEANLKDAQAEWDRLKGGPDAQDIAAAEARILAIRNTLAMDHLTAPFAGTITQVSIKKGDLVQPGTQAFRIDDLSRLLVDVDITEVDINRIQPGQPVTLTYDAIQNASFKGTIDQVSPVGNTVNGVVYFRVTIALDEADNRVRPGMTAAVTITAEQVKDALLVPIRAIQLQNEQYVVHVLRDGQAVPVRIKLGLSADDYSQVVEGLKEGDVIILNPPMQLNPMMGGF